MKIENHCSRLGVYNVFSSRVTLENLKFVAGQFEVWYPVVEIVVVLFVINFNAINYINLNHSYYDRFRLL